MIRLVTVAWAWMIVSAAAIAQEVPPPIPMPKAVPEPAPASPVCGPEGCGCEKCYTTYKLHWLDYKVKVPVLKIKEQEYDVCKKEVEIDWNEEICIRKEIELVPREVLKEVTCCTVKPVKKIDPCTGCMTVEFVPVTETKIVKVTVYDAKPVEKIYKIKRPCLRHVDKIVKMKKLYLECDVEERKKLKGYLIPCEVKERILTPPPPPKCCPDGKCVKP